MNYSDIDRESNCLDQILIVIFVILIIFVVMFYLNPKKNKDESFRERINYAKINYNDDNILDNNNIYSEMEMVNYPKVNNSMMSSYAEMSDTDKFLKRINDKYRSVRMENDIENFNLLDNEPTQDYVDNQYTQDYVTEAPYQDYVTEAPSQDYVTEAPYQDYVTEAPYQDYVTEAPSLDYVTEAPSLDYVTEAPYQDYVFEDSTQNYVNKVPIENFDIEHFANQSEEREKINKVNDLSSPENISGFLNGDQACNMDKQQKELVDDYKKKYFRMYRHQIECPKECQLHKLNLSRCNLSDNNDCEGIFTKDYNNPDVFTLSNLAIDRNNKKECVTCTANDDRQTRNMMVPNSNVNEEDDVKINQRRLNNRNKFADFNDYIDRNGVLETSVDKIAELRTSTTGTCGLSSFGQKVSDVYNNLLSTTYTEDKNKCVRGLVEGINDSNSNDTYASVL
jgi:hypothetical protein